MSPGCRLMFCGPSISYIISNLLKSSRARLRLGLDYELFFRPGPSSRVGQIFRARARALSVEPEGPEPVKIALEPASSSSFLLIKMLKFELEPTSSLLEN